MDVMLEPTLLNTGFPADRTLKVHGQANTGR